MAQTTADVKIKTDRITRERSRTHSGSAGHRHRSSSHSSGRTHSHQHTSKHHHRSSTTPSQFHFNIKILSAKNLKDLSGKSVNPYCTIAVLERGEYLNHVATESHHNFAKHCKELKMERSTPIHKTKKSKTLNPTWDEVYPFRRVDINRDSEILIEIWNLSRIGYHDLFGEVRIPLSELPKGDDALDNWYPICARNGKIDDKESLGTIRILLSAIFTRSKFNIHLIHPATEIKLPDSVLNRLESAQDREQQQVLFEIIRTEREYVRNLDIAIQVFLEGSRARALLSREQLNSIFSNITAIRAVHFDLSQELESLLSHSNPQIIEKGFGKIFLKHAPSFKLYSVYCGNHVDIGERILSLNRRCAMFKEFQDECSELPECRNLALASFLILPLQRMCLYPLLLAALLKNTSTKHEDYKDLSSAYEQIKECVDQVNDRTRQAERVNRMMELQSLLDRSEEFQLLNTTRYVEKEGMLILLPKEKQRYVILFNDVVLIARPRSRGERYAILLIMPYTKLLFSSPSSATTDSNSDNAVFYMIISSGEDVGRGSTGGGVTYKFQATSAKARLEWMQTLDRLKEINMQQAAYPRETITYARNKQSKASKFFKTNTISKSRSNHLGDKDFPLASGKPNHHVAISPRNVSSFPVGQSMIGGITHPVINSPSASHIIHKRSSSGGSGGSSNSSPYHLTSSAGSSTSSSGSSSSSGGGGGGTSSTKSTSTTALPSGSMSAQPSKVRPHQMITPRNETQHQTIHTSNPSRSPRQNSTANIHNSSSGEPSRIVGGGTTIEDFMTTNAASFKTKTRLAMLSAQLSAQIAQTEEAQRRCQILERKIQILEAGGKYTGEEQVVSGTTRKRSSSSPTASRGSQDMGSAVAVHKRKRPRPQQFVIPPLRLSKEFPANSISAPNTAKNSTTTSDDSSRSPSEDFVDEEVILAHPLFLALQKELLVALHECKTLKAQLAAQTKAGAKDASFIKSPVPFKPDYDLVVNLTSPKCEFPPAKSSKRSKKKNDDISSGSDSDDSDSDDPLRPTISNRLQFFEDLRKSKTTTN